MTRYTTTMAQKIYWIVVGALLMPREPIFGQSSVEGEVGGESDPQGFTFESPLKDFGGIEGLIAKILEVVVLVGTPIAVLFIIYSGFLFVTARGNDEKITKAKRALTWTIIGTAILIGAQVIATVLGGTIEQITR